MLVKTVLTNAKVEVEKFNGTDNFSMWQCEIISNKGDKGNDTKKKKNYVVWQIAYMHGRENLNVY